MINCRIFIKKVKKKARNSSRKYFGLQSHLETFPTLFLGTLLTHWLLPRYQKDYVRKSIIVRGNLNCYASSNNHRSVCRCKAWSSLVEGTEQPDRPNSQACVECDHAHATNFFVINTTAYHLCLPL